MKPAWLLSSFILFVTSDSSVELELEPDRNGAPP